MSTTKKEREVDNEVASVLRELRQDLATLKSDVMTLKSDGVSLGRSSLRTAQETAQGAADTARDSFSRTVQTVEDDVAAIAADLQAQVQRNPYTTIGIAVLGGMLLGHLFRRD
ncbi:DUF883 family protein [Parvularcula dongshanensis]|uniref:ElaB/YqjD/DUF883 family membrane-anchored ribosome-binding protein n=1 Tax=Parvularcula dongshanensis TaxID=1173995 RepID=A0A840I3G4_9PROT|nr:DUF883 family protein [Parvularcula dongshanensis]MBB4658842.1 ElaB/YqjD/DUF883 family membrane-anchored ribosome-binding protein [Parvularcula dongshanensis]